MKKTITNMKINENTSEIRKQHKTNIISQICKELNEEQLNELLGFIGRNFQEKCKELV